MSAGELALSIVIPAYNEATRLPPTLVAARRFLDADGRRAEIIVVDDGSRDDTSVRVREAGAEDGRIRLVRLPQNRGKGYAVRTGVMNAVGARVLFADADGSTPFAELRRLGGREGQGFRFARPWPASGFESLLHAGTASGWAAEEASPPRPAERSAERGSRRARARTR